jgi:hypothetical protein
MRKPCDGDCFFERIHIVTSELKTSESDFAMESNNSDPWWTEAATAKYFRRKRAKLAAFSIIWITTLLIVFVSAIYLSLLIEPSLGLITVFVILFVGFTIVLPINLILSLSVSLIATYGIHCPRCGKRLMYVFVEVPQCRRCCLEKPKGKAAAVLTQAAPG